MKKHATNISYWLNRVSKTITPDEVFPAIEDFKQLSWNPQQRFEMWNTYMPILERYYSENPDNWQMYEQLATPRERIQIEKALRGWYGVKLRRYARTIENQQSC